ncbi:MAG: c-type cytochrome [Pirellulaceae bacterium]|nr:c-type cytochrome [Pirellulaceae bacterium]
MFQPPRPYRGLLARCILLIPALLITTDSIAQDTNRLAYLDAFLDPYYVSGEFPKLTTPQWIGEAGVEAVVVLAIDDMRDPARYEAYLRPILERLKQIDGRAPVSIMTNQVRPDDPLLAKWLKEGLSIDVHTINHPCPCLQNSDLPQSQRTYHECVDLMASIPGNRPVAFRMPCCDSLNTPSPRFWTEIFNRTSAKGNFLSIDSSVFNVITPTDKALPREWVLRKDGKERFRHYIPFKSFVNTINNYPYPYLVGRSCWEFPCVVPSDWEAQNVQRSNNPDTVRDMKIALDVTVQKQGVYNLVFHPHGWIRNDQVIDIINHAVEKHGNKVKFLTFREAAERLQTHHLLGPPLRAADGSENGVRLLDLNQDGYLDVIVANKNTRQTRTWSPTDSKWTSTAFPADVRQGATRFGILDDNVIALARTDTTQGAWRWNGTAWRPAAELLRGIEDVATTRGGRDRGLRLRDADGDGQSELIIANETRQDIYRWSTDSWKPADFGWPQAARIVNAEGQDAGLRFVDVDQDGLDDIIFSDQDRYSLSLWRAGKSAGWSLNALAGNRSDADAIPIISRLGTNNGVWFHSDHMWVQNEDTARLPNLVDRRSFQQLLQPLHGDTPPPRSPARSRRSMRVPAGLKIELVASEPLVNDPIAFDWGLDGSLWVVEMGDYPLGSDGRGASGGRIKHLQDTDGDGRFDRSVLFMDKLNFPTGIKCWKEGVLVTAAPEVFFAADTNGDGKADKKQVLFTGFREGNQQHRVNGLKWGLDNWLYLANGDSGGTIKSLKTGKSLDIGGRDLRIRPDTGEMDALAGQTQYGRNRDDWGNWFGGNNSNPMWHYVLEDYVLRRNPHVAAPAVRKQVSVQPGASPIYPTSRTLTRFNDPARANRFTSACSPIVYRDQYLAQLVRNALVCEPVHNLVHRELMEPAGASFTSRRLASEQDSEFLTSSDNWFRPTMIRTGPDGSLWVADMYRLVIEHPKWIPQAWQDRLDLRTGSNLGRIYRITRADDTRPANSANRLSGQSVTQWITDLGSTNGWRRDTAQQQLVWQKDASTVKPLQAMVRTGKSPLARLHALCTLDGMGKLDAKLVGVGLRDRHAGVRRHAARLAQQFPTTELPKLVADLTELESDEAVLMQIAITLGYYDSKYAGITLGRFASQHVKNNYLYAASLSSIHAKNLAHVMQGAFSGPNKTSERLLQHLLAVAAGLGNRDVVNSLVIEWTSTKSYADWQVRAITATLENLQSRKIVPRDFLSAPARAGIEKMIGALRPMLLQKSVQPLTIEGIIRLLGYAEQDQEDIANTLELILVPQQTLELQIAAMSSLLRLPGKSAQRLLQRWASTSPALRLQMINSMLLETRHIQQLLDALQKGKVPPGHLDARQRNQLVEHSDAAIAARAAKIFKISPQGNRQQVVQAYQPALKLTGDTERGRLHYRKHCANCHQLEGVGFAVGPNLAALKVRTSQALLTAILDPNQAVEAKYLEFMAVTKDGRQHAGILSRETSTDITLQAPQGKQTVLLRQTIDVLRSSGKSLMPVGVEKDIPHQAMADIIHYLRSQGPPPKTFPGNKPQVVRPAKPGATIELTTATCRIYGNEIRLEPRYGNLGFWGAAQDRAEWTVELPQAGTYEAWVDFACPQDTAGNPFIFTAGSSQLRGKVPATASWDEYQKKMIGRISLPAGSTGISFRSDGAPRGFLLDLRGIQLVPVR